MRDKYSYKYIKGAGIEIGGNHVPLPVNPGTEVLYVDLFMQPNDSLPVKKNLVIDDAERLDHFDDESLDFIIANHVLEHTHNPIGTVLRWIDAVRNGGILYIALPEKTKTFDAPRAVTSFIHLLDDHTRSPSEMLIEDTKHYLEWHRIIDKLEGQVLIDRVALDVRSKANIHFHVFDLKLMDQFFNYFSDFLIVRERVINGSEVIWVLEKK